MNQPEPREQILRLILYGERTMTLTQKLYPLYFPTNHRCHTCQLLKVASAMQIVAKRQRYFCPACATAKGYPPAKELLNRLPEAQEAKPAPGQKQRKTKAVTGGRK
jgi:hypothetical protein